MYENLLSQAALNVPINGIKPIQKLFDQSKVRRRGVVICRSIRDDKFKENTLTFRCFRGYQEGDLSEKVWFGIPIRLKGDGTFDYQQINIKNQRMFSLENSQDALTWHIVKHHQWMKGSPNSSADTRFEVYDEEMEAMQIINKSKLSISASILITKMGEKDLINYGHLIGVNPTMNPLVVIQARLQQMAMKNPEALLAYHKEQDFTNAKITVKRGVAYGIITRDPMKGFMFRGSQMLGDTEDQAARSLLKDLQILSIIEHESMERETKMMDDKKTERTIIPPAGSIDTIGVELIPGEGEPQTSDLDELDF